MGVGSGDGRRANRRPGREPPRQCWAGLPGLAKRARYILIAVTLVLSTGRVSYRWPMVDRKVEVERKTPSVQEGPRAAGWPPRAPPLAL